MPEISRGTVIGFLTVLAKAPGIRRRTGGTRGAWLCICACSRKVTIRHDHLHEEHSRSCGDHDCKFFQKLCRHKRSSETRTKISAAMRGNKHALGHKHKPEAIAKMSAAMRGKKHALGYKHKPESISKMRGNKNYLGGEQR